MEALGPLQLLQEVIVGVERSRQVNYCNVASITIMALDWLLTFEMEVSLIWTAKWNTTKILYFLTRYLPFIDTSIVIYHQFGYALPVSVCKTTYQYAAFMFVFGMAFAELILTLRTWAVWEKDRRLTYALPALFAAVWISGFTIIGFYLRSTHHMASPVPQLFGCIVQDANQILASCYILLMGYDACILALMVVRGIAAFRSGGDSQFMRVVYSDGIIYYIYLFTLSFVNTIIILKLPGDYVNLMVMVERVIHSVLACRVVLHIRQQGRVQQVVRQENLFGETDRNQGHYHHQDSSVQFWTNSFK
ncbi:hypothetical protein NP233_g2982 [Leucocoprinus birnbaumii]|uniref:DUF6533 domain-containing protein n=1 Tax=Leucocoprinus birnbaumii TaxID=56174 RepID=A0AAD5VXB1_9AGAR|nr:hypothetical protein NP233_g2982 [Leucocoprinus birnbaumii]